MKKFKLIKEYPGSPKLDTTITYKSNYNGGVYEVSKGNFISCVKPENYPEFWEEVVGRDYEILNLKFKKPDYWLHNFKEGQIVEAIHKADGMLYFKINSFRRDDYPGKVAYKGHITNVFDIHSIKRVSDGEVFTVGDRIKDHNGNNTIITKIKLSEKLNSIYIWYGPKANLSLKDTIRLKPLFTTEDGVGIFKGDNCYPVTKDLKISHIYGNILRDGRLSSKKYFSTKEKAEEYILMNKPCLSINEVLSLNFLTKEDLVKFTKKKLNEK